MYRDSAPSANAIGNGSEALDAVDISCGCAVCRTVKSDSQSSEAPSATADETIGSISPGDTVTGVIDASGDVDYFNISLVAGRTYTIVLTGSGGTPLPDAMVSLTRSGTTLGSDDDGGLGYNSLLTFTATADGTYQIAARGYSTATGGYTLQVRQMRSDSSSPDDPAPISVNSTAIGFLETGSDVDTYAVYLEAGQYYSFELAGGADYATDLSAVPPGELNTILSLFDASGNQVAYNDNLASDDPSSGFGFTATQSGTYYVQADAAGTQIGGFTLRVTGVDLSALSPLDTIDWGSQVASNTVTVYFAPEGETYDGVTSEGWSDYEIEQAMEALATYSDVANLNFSITTNQDTATFTLVTTTSNDYLGYFYPPGTSSAGIGVFATNGAGWNTTGGLEPGGYGFITLVHEFGHGLGLAHPHDDGGTSTIMHGVTSPFDDYGTYDLNQGVYTTMSYNDGWQLHPSGSSSGSLNYGYQSGPGALDIAVIQEKYGARSNNIGNTTYVLPTANAAGAFWTTIWDTRGTDTIRHDGTVSATIDLTAATLDYSATGGGVISYVNGIFGGFTIASGTVIENATGGSGNDILLGNSASNVLNGRGGADTMEGRRGSDQYVVNHSGDTVTEAAGEGADLVNASISYTLTANVEHLTLTGTRAISGTGNDHNNVITGNGAANTLSGGAGRDTLDGGAGGDTLQGGADNDTYVVDNAADVVTEAAREGSDLVKSSINYTLGSNVERLTLTGTATTGTGNGVANTIKGSTADNELHGLGGKDTINGGGGADDLYGGTGSDRLTGGAGTDDFYFDSALGSSNVDTILDFATADDSIYLDLSVFTAIASTGALSSGAFRLGTAAQDLNDRIIYDSATGKIYYDADGSGSGSAVLFAQVSAGTTLSSEDFFSY